MYEAKIHPMLRFLHAKNIKSCGWVSVKAKKDRWIDDDSKSFNVDIEINNLKMKDIEPYENETIPGFITASFDIECDSSHGDFPDPVKDFKKVAIDIHESYFRNSINLSPVPIKCKFFKNCLTDCFNEGSNDVQNIYTLNGIYSQKSFDSIITKNK